MVSQFGSLGYTIMGKTADLIVVQKTIIDTLHKEGKPQTFIAKEAGCSQSDVSNCSLMRIVKQNKLNILMRIHFVFHLETKVLESGRRVDKLIAQVA